MNDHRPYAWGWTDPKSHADVVLHCSTYAQICGPWIDDDRTRSDVALAIMAYGNYWLAIDADIDDRKAP